MAAGKSKGDLPSATPPPVRSPAPRSPSGAAAPAKVRAGMGDVVADFVEVYTDAAYQRATGLWCILDADGNAVPADVPDLTPAAWLAMYRGMLLGRLLDERLMAMQRQGRIGFYAEARGQEAAVIAPVAALASGDWVVPSHREGGAALYRGLPIAAYVAQVFGNMNDIGKGRQLPVHPATPRELKVLPMSSCAATQLPQATGIAWAAKIKRENTVVLAYLGEGATSSEDFHTGVNFAAVFKVPVVFVCVNNGWALSTAASAQSASETFAVKALAYGISGVRVDGNDVCAMYAAVHEAVTRARHGEGPTLIEAVTYRMGAHSSSDDPKRYQPAEEVAAWAAKDPLVRFRAWLESGGLLDELRASQMRSEIDREINEAIAANEAVGPPPLATMIEDVFVKPSRALEEQLAELQRVRAAR